MQAINLTSAKNLTLQTIQRIQALPYSQVIMQSLMAIALITLVGRAAFWRDTTAEEPIRSVTLHQQWEIQPGETFGEHTIIGGLGDISIDVNGKSVYAPFQGRLQPTGNRCVILSGTQVPAYLFRFCGLEEPGFGVVQTGDVIGKSQTLSFATLRKQPDGTWAVVEPSREVLERSLIPAE